MNARAIELGLSTAGREWLKYEASLPSAGLGDVDHLARAVARSFGITTREAMVAVCSSLSTMIGHSVIIQEPCGSLIPCSMQLLVASDGGCNVLGAVECLNENVVEMLSQTLGRRRMEFPSTLDESLVKLLNLRRQQSFPIGDLLGTELVKRLIEEDSDSAFGSISYEQALLNFLQLPTKDAPLVENFMRAGWRGNPVSGVEGHPVYPTVSIAWGASSGDIHHAVSSGILDRLPGLLIVKPRFNETDRSSLPAPWPSGLRSQWIALLTRLFERRIKTPPRHVEPEGQLALVFDERAAQEVASLSSFQGRYSDGVGQAAKLLRHAPQQVAKIAALLTLFQSSNTISMLSVEFAKEIYRGLCRGTFDIVDHVAEACPESDVSRRRKILEKLKIYGCLTFKDLVGASPKLGFENLSALVLSMVEEGLLSNDEGRLSHVSVRAEK